MCPVEGDQQADDTTDSDRSVARTAAEAVGLVVLVACVAFTLVALVFGIDTRGPFSRDRGGSLAEWAAAAGTFMALVLLVYELRLLRTELGIISKEAATTQALVERQQDLFDEAAEDKRAAQAADVAVWFRLDPERSHRFGAFPAPLSAALEDTSKRAIEDVQALHHELHRLETSSSTRPEHRPSASAEEIATVMRRAQPFDGQLTDHAVKALERLQTLHPWLVSTDGNVGSCAAFDVVVQNLSNAPVFDVYVWLAVPHTERRRIVDLPVVEPGEVTWPMRVEAAHEAAPRGRPEIFTSAYRPIAEFTDANGRRWRRDFRATLIDMGPAQT